MRLRVFILALAALALSGCAGWFGGGHHHRRPAGGAHDDWHPPREMLEKYDANHDGTLTRAELEAGLRADFAKDDANHDGRLDIDEVRAVNQARWSANSSTTSPLVDWNHDGFVDFQEFAAAPRSLFDQMDANGDGKLAPDELHPRPKQRSRERPRPMMGPGDPGGY